MMQISHVLECITSWLLICLLQRHVAPSTSTASWPEQTTVLAGKVDRLQHVFVYGTLLAGEQNHRLLVRSRLVDGPRPRPPLSCMTWGCSQHLWPAASTLLRGKCMKSIR